MNSAGNYRVLIVDDEPGLNLCLAEFLEDLDYAAVTAGTAGEAFQRMLDSGPFDVALVDLRLPDINGETLILKAHDEWPELHFIMQTGSTDYRLPDALLQTGMKPEQLLYKPIFDLDTVHELIQRIMTEA